MERLKLLLFAPALAGAVFARERHIETVDSDGFVGEYTSPAPDSSDHPHISGCDFLKADLIYAYKEKGSCLRHWRMFEIDHPSRRDARNRPTHVYGGCFVKSYPSR